MMKMANIYFLNVARVSIAGNGWVFGFQFKKSGPLMFHVPT
jgi:hypothetical protein